MRAPRLSEPHAGSAEIRQITVFFCDIVGSSELAARLDPEDLHSLLREFHARCGEVVRRNRGHIAQYLGDGLLAYFGYPSAAEDDARSAASAGLEILGAVASMNQRGLRRAAASLEVRVGIHTGRVVVGNVGSEGREESLALGETPNLAARVQAVAQPSSVLVSDTTHQLLTGHFRCQELGSHNLRGFRSPIRLFQVLAELNPVERQDLGRDGQSPLVGRGPELAAIEQAWRAARSGSGRYVTVRGEAGIGKTRLVRELAQIVSGQAGQVLEGRCAPYHQRTAFHPIAQWLEADLGIAPDASPASKFEAIARLPLGAGGLDVTRRQLLAGVLKAAIPTDYPTLDLQPHLLQKARFDALGAWLCAKREPTLVVVEDLHWADPSSLEFLDHLAKSLGDAPVLIVATTRSDLAPAPSDARAGSILLERLVAADTDRIVSYITGAKPLPASVEERLLAKSEGIPLVLEEMTRALLDSGILKDSGTHYSMLREDDTDAIPATLQNSLTARLDRLGRAKPTIQLAAVLGREFRRELLEAVWISAFGLSRFELERDLEDLVKGGLLYVSAGRDSYEYTFKHALVQDAAYQSLLRSSRREYHHRVADTLTRQFPDAAQHRPEFVAHHYSSAEQPALAADWCERAGQQALQLGAHQEAIAHFRAALGESAKDGAARPPSREIDLLVGLGVASVQTKGFASPEVAEAYGRAVELCDAGAEIPVRVLYGLWLVNMVRSELEQTQRLLRHMHELNASGDASIRLISHACLGNWHFYRGEYAAAELHLARAAALCDRDDPRRQHEQLLRDHGFEGVLYAPLYLAWCSAVRGHPARAVAQWQEALAHAERIGDPYVVAKALVFGAALHHDLGQAEQAAVHAERVCRIAIQKSFPFWLASGLATSGWALCQSGDVSAGLSRIKEGLGLFRQIGARMPYPYYLAYLADAQMQAGLHRDAADSLSEALAMADANVDCNPKPELLRLRGQLWVHEGRPDLALQCFEQAASLAALQDAQLIHARIRLDGAALLERMEAPLLAAQTQLLDPMPSAVEAPSPAA